MRLTMLILICVTFSIIITQWIRSHEEGIIHPSVRIGRERPGDPTSINGLFVSLAPDAKPIEKDEVIAQIPWDL